MFDKPADKLCECGHRWRWYSTGNPPDDLDEIFGNLDGLRMESDVVERDCPHRNGTVIEYCPKCDAKVSMWGCGPAGGMECDCWDAPAPRWRFRRQIEAMPPRRYARAAKRAAQLAHELAQKVGRKVSPTVQYLVDTPEDEIARRQQGGLSKPRVHQIKDGT